MRYRLLKISLFLIFLINRWLFTNRYTSHTNIIDANIVYTSYNSFFMHGSINILFLVIFYEEFSFIQRAIRKPRINLAYTLFKKSFFMSLLFSGTFVTANILGNIQHYGLSLLIEKKFFVVTMAYFISLLIYYICISLLFCLFYIHFLHVFKAALLTSFVGIGMVCAKIFLHVPVPLNGIEIYYNVYYLKQSLIQSLSGSLLNLLLILGMFFCLIYFCRKKEFLYE